MEFFQTIIIFFQSDFSRFLSFMKVFSIILSVGFLLGSIYSWLQLLNLFGIRDEKRHKHFEKIEKPKSPRMKQWESISLMFKSGDTIQARMAIIDADTILEELVTDMGYQGDSFGEKLMSLRKGGIAWTDAAWDVHLLRNKLAHEGSKYPLTDREAFRAYKIYENILVGTGYIA